MSPRNPLAALLLLVPLAGCETQEVVQAEPAEATPDIAAPIHRAAAGAAHFRLSDLGTTGDADAGTRANDAAIAASATDGTYLVVWDGGDTGSVGQEEIHGQIVGADGSETGTDFVISEQSSSNAAFDAKQAAVAWNAANNQYLVVWSGDESAGHAEIYGQFVGADGSIPGGTLANFKISTTTAGAAFDAVDPRVAYNATSGEFVVVWEAPDTTEGDQRVWLQRLDASGAAVGSVVEVSSGMTAGRDAVDPDVAIDDDGKILVVWRSNEDDAADREIFGRLFTSAGVEEVAAAALTTMGSDGTSRAEKPRVAWNPTSDRYLLVFHGDEAGGGLADGEQEIWGQALDSTLSADGARFRISTFGTDGDASQAAVEPDVVAHTVSGGWFVSFAGGSLGSREVYGIELDAARTLLGSAEQLSSMANAASDAQDGAVAFDAGSNAFLTVFEGDDIADGFVDDEDEIYGRLFDSAAAVNAAPVADAGGPYSANEGVAIAFTDGSTDSDGTIVSWLWEFGDGGISTDQNPTYAYPVGGDYTVTLTVTDDGGATGQVTVAADINRAPVASPTLPTGNEGVALAFSGGFVDLDGGGGHTYLWDFGDGSTSMAQNPTHTYTDDGVYPVSFTVTDPGGLSGVFNGSVTVSNVAPVANATFPADGDEGNAFAFSAAPTDVLGDSTFTYAWDFGDGSLSTDPAPSHTYADDGAYTVTLRVTDDDGGESAEESHVLTVGNVAPVANASIPSAGLEGTGVAFTASPTDAGTADTFTYAWTFGDGQSSSAASPTHSFADDGVYTVSLTVTDDDGGVASLESSTVTIGNVAPLALPGGPYSALENEALAFTGGQLDPGADTFTYSWDFGDGGSSTDQNPTHTYTAGGDYTVSLTVTDDDGGANTATTTARIGDVDPLDAVVDSLIQYANDTYTANNGGGDVLFEASSRPGRRPSVIQGRLQDILDDLGRGCLVTPEPMAWAGGAYDGLLLDGFHSVGDATISNGSYVPASKGFGGTLDGTGLDFGHPGAFSTYNNQGQQFALRSDGGWFAGRWIRISGLKGVWVALHGTCDDTGATAREALDGWYAGGLLP